MTLRDLAGAEDRYFAGRGGVIAPDLTVMSGGGTIKNVRNLTFHLKLDTTSQLEFIADPDQVSTGQSVTVYETHNVLGQQQVYRSGVWTVVEAKRETAVNGQVVDFITCADNRSLLLAESLSRITFTDAGDSLEEAAKAVGLKSTINVGGSISATFQPGTKWSEIVNTLAFGAGGWVVINRDGELVVNEVGYSVANRIVDAESGVVLRSHGWVRRPRQSIETGTIIARRDNLAQIGIAITASLNNGGRLEQLDSGTSPSTRASTTTEQMENALRWRLRRFDGRSDQAMLTVIADPRWWVGDVVCVELDGYPSEWLVTGIDRRFIDGRMAVSLERRSYASVDDGRSAGGPVTPAAPPAPAAPTWSLVRETTARINWSFVSATPSVLHYDVRYRTTNVGAWTQVEDVTALRLDVTGLAASTSYEAQVRAVNSEGDGLWSASRTVTTAAAASAPSVVRSLADTPTADGTVATWVAPASGDTPITYDVEYRAGHGSAGNVAWISAATGISALTYTFTGLSAGTDYRWRIRASNSVGDGPWSGKDFTTAAPAATNPSVPTNVGATPGDGQVTLSWSAPASWGNAAAASRKYEVQIGSDTVVEVDDSVTSHTFTGLTNGTAVTVRVRAKTANGTSAWVADSATPVVTPTNPSQPTSVAGIAGDGQATLTWAAPLSWGNGAANTREYEVQIDTAAVVEVSVGTTSWTFTGLTNGVSVAIRVRAVTENGRSAWASTTATPVATPVVQYPAPTNLQASARVNGVVTFTWDGIDAYPSGATDTRGRFEWEYSTASPLDFTNPTGSGIVAVGSPDYLRSDTVGTRAINLGTDDATFRVRCHYVLAAGGTAKSEWVSIAVVAAAGTPPGVPRTLVLVAASDVAVLAEWLAPAAVGDGVTSYVLQWWPTADSTDTTDVTGITGVSHEVTGLTAATNYTMRVRATGPGGDGPWTATADVSTDAAPVATSSWLREDGGKWLREDGGLWLREDDTN